MIQDKPRALISAAVFFAFCLAAAAGGAAQAAEVYPGCAEPGSIGHVWYVDPVNGKTPADGGNGSRTTPWNSLQGVVSSTKQPGYRYPMLSTIPYDHYPQTNAERKRIRANHWAFVQPDVSSAEETSIFVKTIFELGRAEPWSLTATRGSLTLLGVPSGVL